ncbi:GNAT family N-acetyltransferase [Veronia pacifica]|uniref:Histone acetyltransferase n=1 Tax=Veronia pacifica TaxID=1080227 RepID=A0A1C3EQV6_9GAMM|nr:GNAT family N-acetyltransferase [Veronia pacifica]ODA35624.1 histone acetyltransferase [Veronia pacifica]
MLTLRPINIDEHFDVCQSFRKDSYFCSFGTLEGFKASVKDYEQKIRQRLADPAWFYRHVWQNGEIIGQLEFKTHSFKSGYGYVHLIYLQPEYRGIGLASQLQDYISTHLLASYCKGAVLSVSRDNPRAVAHYIKSGWSYLQPNPKHRQTDFWCKAF